MGWENVRTKEKGLCIDHSEIRSFIQARPRAIFLGHNIVKFDAPALNRLLGLRIGLSRIVDTLVLSTLYHPSLPGGHSLGAWGDRIGMEKGDFNDFSQYTDEMGTYCQQDVSITAELYRRLCNVLNKIGFTEKTCEIQHKITSIINRQHKTGFYFNGTAATELHVRLRDRTNDLEDSVRRAFPPEDHVVRTRDVYTKSGEHCQQYAKDLGRYRIELSDDGRSYTAFESVPFNLGSPKQRVEKLLELGWVNTPDEVTKTGLPKPFDKNDLVPSLQAFLEDNPVPEVALIARWMALSGRLNMIGTWLENLYDDSCIHGKLFTADTLRFRHQAPNTANIPAVRVAKDGSVLLGEAGYYTYEARDLWTARPGRVLVGTDAAGLELRMLAHYLNRPAFTEQVVNGDPHQYNADLAGVTRPNAKTLLYSIQYGAQAKKVASILKSTLKEGAKMRQTFLDRLGLTGVMEQAQDEQRNGRVFLVDGAGLICPSPHAALNYKLQGGGARVMALTSILLEDKIRRNGLDSLPVGNIHDELQYDVLPSDAEQHGRLAQEAIREAGEELGLKVPMEMSVAIGSTWAKTH